MTKFWCPWCGATERASDPRERVQCTRCICEFVALFGFVPEAAMTPLEANEQPGEPEAARKRFTFRSAGGDLIGSTWSPSDEERLTG